MFVHIKKHILFGMNCNTIKLNKQRIKITAYCCINTAYFLTFWKYTCLRIGSVTWNTHTELNAECWHYRVATEKLVRVFIIIIRWCTEPPHLEFRSEPYSTYHPKVFDWMLWTLATLFTQHNLYLTNALRPFKVASYECTKKFKCPVHSCRGLEL